MSDNALNKKGVCACMCNHKRRRRGGRGAIAPKLGRNLFDSGNFSERAIGNLGRTLTERLQPPLI